MTSVPPFSLGIDLGTTNSVIAVYRDDKVEVLLDRKQRNITPSVVSYTENEILVGYSALEQYPKNPKNTIIEVKRLMGRKFEEKQVQEDINEWPYKIVNKDGDPRIEVEYRSETRQMRPEQISSIILKDLKERACRHLGLSSTTKNVEAVVTVPVYFSDAARNATKEACGIAGIDVTKILTEPAAAALAYTLEASESGPSRVLVFDMGGGTTDVSLLKVFPGAELQVLTCKGDNHLGGEDLDREIVKHCSDHIYEEHKIRLDKQEGALVRLRFAAERAKCELSSSDMTEIKLDQIKKGVTFEYQISRKTFENLAVSKLKDAIKLVKECLTEAKIAPCDVGRVILAGGSTKIPLLQQLLTELLPGVPLHSSIKQEEAVARGAALQAAKDKGIIKTKFNLSEILPWSLGTDVEGGRTYIILPKNTPIPTKVLKKFSTTVDNQKTISIEIYEGENEFCKDNKLIGSMILSNIRKAPKGQVKIIVGFSIDNNGILQVAAKEKHSDNKMSITIDRYKKEMTPTQIESFKATTEEDFQNCLATNLSRQLEKLKLITQDDQNLHRAQRKIIKKECDEVHKWIKSNPNPTQEDFNLLLKDVRGIIKLLGLEITIEDDGNIEYQKNN